ncbi:hypothetical protein [Parasitella parasitica]|uniref:Uncharacterized protein n=1 Tax=Parasitella parasitica TaxID=35722 RepID=A0A0B7MYP9_9FUNG|nr:hypothetical protein [Parasitella parasitica]
MASNSIQVNKDNKQVDSTMAVQVQSVFGSCEPTPMDVIDETCASSTSISNVIDDISDMSTSSSNVPRNDDIHASNTSCTAVNEGYQGSSTASYSSSVAFKDIGYSITSSEERRALMKKIERLELAVFKTTVTSIDCPNGSIVPNYLGVLTRQLETAQRTYDLVFSKMETTLVPPETPYFEWRS